MSFLCPIFLLPPLATDIHRPHYARAIIGASKYIDVLFPHIVCNNNILCFESLVRECSVLSMYPKLYISGVRLLSSWWLAHRDSTANWRGQLSFCHFSSKPTKFNDASLRDQFFLHLNFNDKNKLFF